MDEIGNLWFGVPENRNGSGSVLKFEQMINQTSEIKSPPNCKEFGRAIVAAGQWLAVSSNLGITIYENLTQTNYFSGFSTLGRALAAFGNRLLGTTEQDPGFCAIVWIKTTNG